MLCINDIDPDVFSGVETLTRIIESVESGDSDADVAVEKLADITATLTDSSTAPTDPQYLSACTLVAMAADILRGLEGCLSGILQFFREE